MHISKTFPPLSSIHLLTRFILFFFYALSSHTILAEETIQSPQIIELQNKVKVLEMELLAIKALLNERTANQSLVVLENDKTISAPDRLILKSGKSMLELTKGGKITLKGVSFDIKTEQDQQVRGSKIMNN